MTQIKTTALDVDTIAALLKEEKKREEPHRVNDALYRHNFDRKMLYLLGLPYEQMFVPEKSTSALSEGKWHCIACAAIGIQNRESHFNWHKRELAEYDN